jgi:N-acetylneuraminic acid mutarotase
MNKRRTVRSAPARSSLDEGGFVNLRSTIAVLVCALVGCSVLSATLLGFFSPQAALKISERTLSFAERVSYQRAIEDVYWRHRIWPNERRDPKPPLDSVMPLAQLEKRVAYYLRKSQAVEDYWQRPITAEQLQAEMDRMAANTKQPEVLRELFEALGNDPFVIAECLARPIAAERLLAGLNAPERFETESKHSRLANTETKERVTNAVASRRIYMLPVIDSTLAGCTEDTWTPTSTTNAPNARAGHTAVWTGIEMIVWGGGATGPTYLKTGGRYNPSTDSWTAANATNAPDARAGHTALWTGSEMIVWGGFNDSGDLNTGGRYNPGTDSWTATSTINAPVGRQDCSAVWTGSEMIVWGGYDGAYLNTGGRYNPSMDSWTATSNTNAPPARYEHTAVWSGSEMIVWGGFFRSFALNTGGRYNPGTDRWTPTSTTNAPAGRGVTMSVWTGREMIIWGGWDDLFFLNTGGRYNPGTDTWKATSTTDAPTSRFQHSAVWTGNEMIVWGGWDPPNIFDTGGKYNPGTDSWTPTSTTNAPTARYVPTGVWTGSEMIVWGGGASGPTYFNTGGRYCGQAPTPTPTATPTPRATPVARIRPTPVPRP